MACLNELQYALLVFIELVYTMELSPTANTISMKNAFMA